MGLSDYIQQKRAGYQGGGVEREPGKSAFARYRQNRGSMPREQESRVTAYENGARVEFDVPDDMGAVPAALGVLAEGAKLNIRRSLIGGAARAVNDTGPAVRRYGETKRLPSARVEEEIFPPALEDINGEHEKGLVNTIVAAMLAGANMVKGLPILSRNGTHASNENEVIEQQAERTQSQPEVSPGKEIVKIKIEIISRDLLLVGYWHRDNSMVLKSINTNNEAEVEQLEEQVKALARKNGRNVDDIWAELENGAVEI